MGQKILKKIIFPPKLTINQKLNKNQGQMFKQTDHFVSIFFQLHQRLRKIHEVGQFLGSSCKKVKDSDDNEKHEAIDYRINSVFDNLRCLFDYELTNSFFVSNFMGGYFDDYVIEILDKNSKEWIGFDHSRFLTKDEIQIIMGLCEESSYGDIKSGENLKNKNVRNAFELLISDENFRVRNKTTNDCSNLRDFFNSSLCSTLIDQISKKFNIPFEIVPHKLNIYPVGGLFKKHVDTPIDTKRHFGSLVVSLNSYHRGGSLQINHDTLSTKIRFDTNTLSRPWVAFYSDCVHEVEKVVEGYRMTLTFSLLAKDETIVPLKLVESTINTSSLLKNVIRLTQESCDYSEMDEDDLEELNIFDNCHLEGNKLFYDGRDYYNGVGFILSHTYTNTYIESEFDYSKLKQIDKVFVDSLSKFIDKEQYELIVVPVASRLIDDSDYDEENPNKTDYYLGRLCDLLPTEFEDLNPKIKNLKNILFFNSTQSRYNLLFSQEDEGAENTGNEARNKDCEWIYWSYAAIVYKKSLI